MFLVILGLLKIMVIALATFRVFVIPNCKLKRTAYALLLMTVLGFGALNAVEIYDVEIVLPIYRTLNLIELVAFSYIVTGFASCIRGDKGNPHR
jgi:hypothetical protein